MRKLFLALAALTFVVAVAPAADAYQGRYYPRHHYRHHHGYHGYNGYNGYHR
jgi:hypothetical protein